MLSLFRKEWHEHLSKLCLCYKFQKTQTWVNDRIMTVVFGEVSLALYFLLYNQWSLSHTKGKWHCLRTHYAISRLCSLQWKAPDLLFLHVKVFQPAFCAAFIPLLLTPALIAAWGTMTETCTHAAAYWPTTLSVENQSWNKKQRERRGKKEMPVIWTGFEKVFFPPVVILVTSFRSDAQEHEFCLCCTVWSESKHTTVFSLCHYHRINSIVA